MILQFAWRYFRAKKSVNAINIIASVTTVVIAFATCCQILVLSVFNGFEGLVSSLYSSFYTDLKVIPAQGKTFILSADSLRQLKGMPGIAAVSMVAEEKSLLQNGESQSVITLKAVDENYRNVSGVAAKISQGEYNLGTLDEPGIVLGYGIQNAASVSMSRALPPEQLTVILPKKTLSNEATDAMSEGIVTARGVFIIQQDIDNQFAFTNLDFGKQLTGLGAAEYTASEIRFKDKVKPETARAAVQNFLGKNFVVQTLYQQNATLYNTMNLEKWAIYAVFTLILLIAAFAMVSALTILVLEKKKDIAVLRAMGATKSMIQKIFLAEGLLLGITGTAAGAIFALIICFLQIKYKLIKLSGGSFLIDYFPVKLLLSDFLLVGGTAIFISLLASWFPAVKAASETPQLK